VRSALFFPFCYGGGPLPSGEVLVLGHALGLGPPLAARTSPLQEERRREEEVEKRNSDLLLSASFLTDEEKKK
jgi:hypothetical protein